MRVPSGDHAGRSTASSRSHTVTTSPGISTGATRSEPPPSSASLPLVNASLRPSGDHTGWVSPCSPPLNWYGGDDPSAAAIQIALR